MKNMEKGFKKILALNGSFSGNKGYTFFLLNKIREGVISNDSELEIINLSEKKIKRCIGCNTCQTDAHYLRCIYAEKDDCREIFSKMAEAEVIIYATPIYIFTMSSLMKCFLERLYSTADCSQIRVNDSGLFFHHVSDSITKKPIIPLIVYDNIEKITAENIINYFKIFERFFDSRIIAKLVRNSSKIGGKGINHEQELKFPRIIKIHESFKLAGKEIAVKGYITKKIQKACNQEIIAVPGFKYLKKLKFFKKIVIKKMNEYI